jgi:hypothetical protein
MPRFKVERTFDHPLTEQDLKEAVKRMEPCLVLYGVKSIRSYWSSDHQRMICEYDAADAASVRSVQCEAGASFDRVWPADLLAP